MTSNVDTMCQDCGNQDGISSEQFGWHTMCQACKDIALFNQPPPNEECSICFLTLPSLITGSKYQSCCGKRICSGCILAVSRMDPEDMKCPWCRVPMAETDEEVIKMTKKRMEMGDTEAIYNLGCCYYHGENGLPQNRAKALELWHRSGGLGCAESYYNIGNAYYRGEGVEIDIEKAKHYWELAAIGGDEEARHNLGIHEGRFAGNMSIALKHHMIAAGCGQDHSLKKIREFYRNGHATKDDYAKALQAYQTYVDEIKSVQRDKAATFNSEKYRYY